MKNYRKKATNQMLKDYLSYDAETGRFTWIKTRGYNIKIGDTAGTKHSKGYIQISFGGVHLAHRLAWFFYYGVMPTGLIDHENRIKSDNRIRNLREATNEKNLHNINTPQKNTTTGYLGVSKSRKGFTATITANKKIRYLGTYPTASEASKAYFSAKKELHEFYSG